MDIEEKNVLAQWMGWRIKNPFPPSFAEYFRDVNNSFYRSSFNPDTDHKQFAEVWMKLGEIKRIHIISDFNGFRDPQNWTVVLLHNLPKVMEAVLEVIKGE